MSLGLSLKTTGQTNLRPKIVDINKEVYYAFDHPQAVQLYQLLEERNVYKDSYTYSLEVNRNNSAIIKNMRAINQTNQEIQLALRTQLALERTQSKLRLEMAENNLKLMEKKKNKTLWILGGTNAATLGLLILCLL